MKISRILEIHLKSADLTESADHLRIRHVTVQQLGKADTKIQLFCILDGEDIML